MKILVDSSVLLDVFTQDPKWARWSEEKLAIHGAHAATEKVALLTRDVSRYRTYYPSVQLIIPGQET